MSVRPQPLPLHQSSGAKALHLEMQVTLNALAGRACTSVKAVQTCRVCRAVNDLSKETPVTETGSGFAGSPDYAKGTGIFEGEAEVLNDDNALRVRPLLLETRRNRATWLWRPYKTSCSCLTCVISTSVLQDYRLLDHKTTTCTCSAHASLHGLCLRCSGSHGGAGSSRRPRV